VVISTDSSGSSGEPCWKGRAAAPATDADYELVEQRERAHLLDTRRRRLSEQLELAQARSDAIVTAATARGDWQRRRYDQNRARQITYTIRCEDDYKYAGACRRRVRHFARHHCAAGCILYLYRNTLMDKTPRCVCVDSTKWNVNFI
jgi:hypothetical protein